MYEGMYIQPHLWGSQIWGIQLIFHHYMGWKMELKLPLPTESPHLPVVVVSQKQATVSQDLSDLLSSSFIQS